jgi:hypothetical protein
MRYDREALEARHRELMAQIPAGYSPWLHLAIPSVFALLAIALSASRLSGVSLYELLSIPVIVLLGSAIEWRAHRDLLHRPLWPVDELWRRHLEHHSVYLYEDMEIRDLREFRLVLLPAYGLLLIFVGIFPIALLLHLLGQTNLGALFLMTAMVYVLLYEWLHLAYHLPKEHPIGGLRLIARLRRHHAVHHAPPLMQRWNFNVTFPLWDWVRGTTYRGEPPKVSEWEEGG